MKHLRKCRVEARVELEHLLGSGGDTHTHMPLVMKLYDDCPVFQEIFLEVERTIFHILLKYLKN